jgi:hypothetical protein
MSRGGWEGRLKKVAILMYERVKSLIGSGCVVSDSFTNKVWQSFQQWVNATHLAQLCPNRMLLETSHPVGPCRMLLEFHIQSFQVVGILVSRKLTCKFGGLRCLVECRVNSLCLNPS